MGRAVTHRTTVLIRAIRARGSVPAGGGRFAEQGRYVQPVKNAIEDFVEPLNHVSRVRLSERWAIMISSAYGVKGLGKEIPVGREGVGHQADLAVPRCRPDFGSASCRRMPLTRVRITASRASRRTVHSREKRPRQERLIMMAKPARYDEADTTLAMRRRGY